MIFTDAELAFERKQLGHIERALESLRADVQPKNPRNFIVFSEGYVEQIDLLRDEIDAYLVRKKYNSPETYPAIELPIKYGEAAKLAARGETALIAGDTSRAAEAFAEAAKTFEMTIVSKWKQSEIHYCRLLAAAQYFRGGHYQKAGAIVKKIQGDVLVHAYRTILQELRREIESRSGPNYRIEIRKRLRRNWTSKKHAQIIEILRHHPYCLARADLAHLRALCCERIGDYFATAVFFSDSWRLSPFAPLPPENPKAVFLATSFPYLLIHPGHVAEAVRCVRYQLKHMPHPITLVNASLLRYHQVTNTPDKKERAELISEQLDLCEEAWSKYQQMPLPVRNDDDIRHAMTHCLQCAAFSAAQVDKDTALKLCDRAVEFDPTFWGPWTARGMISFPNSSAINDFRKAVQLGDISWHPYYYLAVDALANGRFAETGSWGELALQRRPNELAEAHLYMALGIARLSLGTSPDEVKGLFAKASEIAPTDVWVQRNWSTFRKAMSEGMVTPQGFERNIKPLETRDDYMARQLAIMDNQRAEQDNLSFALA